MTNEGEWKKKGVFGVGSVPLCYARKEEKMTTRVIGREADHGNVREQAVNVCRKGSSSGDVLYYVTYKRAERPHEAFVGDK